jgi:hypothetical protein
LLRYLGGWASPVGSKPFFINRDKMKWLEALKNIFSQNFEWKGAKIATSHVFTSSYLALCESIF